MTRVLGLLSDGAPRSAFDVGYAAFGPVSSRTGRVTSSGGGGDYAAQMLLGRMRSRGLVAVEVGYGSSRWRITPLGMATHRAWGEGAGRVPSAGPDVSAGSAEEDAS